MSLFGISVLLVEDEEQVAETVKIFLKEAQPVGWSIKYTVKHVDTLMEAKKYISAGGWDVILLDLGLPNGQGITTFRECYAAARAPIIVLTGTADLQTIQNVLREGAARCFEKTEIMSSLSWLHYAIVSSVENWRLSSTVERLQETAIGKLRNLITACSNCHRWRDAGTDTYMMPEEFLEKHNIYLSHSVCPPCARMLYGDLAA